MTIESIKKSTSWSLICSAIHITIYAKAISTILNIISHYPKRPAN